MSICRSSGDRREDRIVSERRSRPLGLGGILGEGFSCVRLAVFDVIGRAEIAQSERILPLITSSETMSETCTEAVTGSGLPVLSTSFNS